MSTEIKPYQYYAVDLDGTLAKHGVSWPPNPPWEIGEPIEPMVKLVQSWIAKGIRVKICTARLANLPISHLTLETKNIQDWAEKHIGYRLEVTCQKDFNMIALYDDRAIQVQLDTGRLVVQELLKDIVKLEARLEDYDANFLNHKDAP